PEIPECHAELSFRPNSVRACLAPRPTVYSGQGVEAVHRRSIIGAFAGGLAAGRQGTMRISARPRRRIVLWRVRLPCALPNMFAGLKVAISLALVGAIVGEFVASSRGLGYMIMTAEGTFDTSQIFAAITMLRIVGVIPFQIVEITERRLIPSHSSQRGR
ncbi:MAG: ABC transporter permease, partial [Acetobacteraceae bacterium]